jgi:hypothetical protein
LKRKHGADLGTVKNIEEKGLNDIIFVVTQGDLVTFEPVGNMEKTFSSFPGAKETRIFSILSAIRLNPDIGELNVVREPFCFKKILQDLGPTGINPSTLRPEGRSLLRVDHERAFDSTLKRRA